MDKKPNKLNSVTTTRFNEISEEIKASIALLTQLSGPFQFSQPVEVSAPISNLNFLGQSNFTFSEPLKEIKVEDNSIIDELRESLSSLAIQDSEFESTIKLQYPLESPDENVSNEGNVPWMFSIIKTEDEVVSNDGNESISVRSDNIHIKLEKSFEIFDEIESDDVNENVSARLENTEESTVARNCSIQISDNADSSDRSDDCKEQSDDNSVTSDRGSSGHTFSIQGKWYEESDEEFELDSNDPALSVRFNGLTEHSFDNKEVGNNEACNIRSENQRSSLQIDCNERQVQDAQMECNEEQNVDIGMASNKSNEHIQPCSVTLNCFVQQSDNEKMLLKDVNKNIPVSNIPIAYSSTQDVHNVIPNNNSPTNACRSRDVDHNTQIKHFEVDSRNVTLNCPVEQDVDGDELLKDVNENIPVPNIPIAYSSTQDVDNVIPNDNSPTNACRSGGVDRNTQIQHFEVDSRSVTLNCPVEQDVDGDELLKDVNENIPVPNINSKSQDAENTTPADNSDNNQTVACRSGDIDPNTQITNLEVDSHIRPAQKLYDNQPLPFLIQHIHKISWANQEEDAFTPVMQLFGQSFKTVMIYGVVTSLTVEQGGLTLRFVIDDGSGSINVVWKASKQILELLKTIHHLDEEVKLCRKTGLSVMNENWQPNSEECKKMLDSFDKIIHYIKRQITERTKLKLFGYAGVVGKPFRSRNIVQLFATHIEDNSRDRSLELYFKKNLIRLYEEKYKPNG